MTTAGTEAALWEELPPKQAHLIRATYDVISDKGVHRVSLQQIADRARVSKGVILYYFQTKENLILQTMQWVLSRTAARIGAAIAAVPGAREQVAAMVDVIFLGPDANRRFYLTYLDLLDHAARLDEFERLAATFRSIVNTAYATVIERGIAEGEFTVDDVAEAATTVRAIVDGVFVQWLQESDWRGTHHRYRSICQRAVLAYLRAGARAG